LQTLLPGARDSAQDKCDTNQQGRAAEPRTSLEGMLQVKLPRPVEVTLSNGINVMILEDHRFPLDHRAFDITERALCMNPQISWTCRSDGAIAPGRYEDAKPANKIAEQIDSLGASLSSSAGFVRARQL